MEVPPAEVTPEHLVHLLSLLCSGWTDPVGLSMGSVQPAGLARVLSWTMREVAPSLRAHDASVRSAQSLEYGALTRRCQRLVVPLVGVKLFRHTPQMMGPKAHQPLATRIARRRLRLSAHVAVTYLDISSTGAADAESGPGAGVRT